MAVTGLELFAAAANGAPATEFSTSDQSQWWVDVLASALDGLVFVPFALFFVWGMRRLNLHRWPIVTAFLATVFALFASGLTHEFIAPIFIFSEKMLEIIGLRRFVYQLLPGIFVCFASVLAIAWMSRRREPIDPKTFQ
ncbi:hypothetical protein [Aurantiacibacter aquimixticola]|uniref:Uncharacterized protein n=1 Tax=Aurantiacibacter aquimixticola TaxID=1958945 RepID=A0A419RST6_9SPHN|nr:hypothetical protein [Aurantiacibacter aquimixticola]RJY08804.1 hypothetical protein D6201_05005 [Aurantiacibacter aquimixticola]